MGGLFIVAISALAAYDIYRNYHAAAAETARELDTHARVLAEQTARSLQAIDLVLRHIAEQRRQGPLGVQQQGDLHAYLKNQAVGVVQSEGLLLFDANGKLVASSQTAELPNPPIDVSNDPLYPVLKHGGSELAVGNVQRGVLHTDRWVLPIARRLVSGNGAFVGAVVAGGRIDYFQQFYNDVRPDAGTTITLMHRNGSLVARHPAMPSAMGQRFPVVDTMLALRQANPSGPMRSVSPVDGVDRFGAIALVPDHPLAVIVTRDADVAMGSWRQQSIGTIARTLALGVLAALLLAMLRRQFQRLDKTRASLELSRERFALAAAGSDEGIWDWDVSNDRVYASARAREIFGLPPGPDTQAREQWFGELRLHPDDVAVRNKAMQAHMSGNTPVYEGEYRVWNHGDWRWVRVRGLCVRNAAGAPLRMAGSVTDIDARRRAEDARRLSEERYALAMTGLTGGHWVWETQTDALFVSDSVHQLFGLPPDTVVTTRTEYFRRVRVHPDDWAGLAKVNEDVVSGATPRIDYEFRILLPGSGAIRWILTRAQSFRDAEGRTLRVAGVSVDISERKRTEEALRLSEERFALAVLGSDDGVWDFDYVNNRVFGSRRCREILGVPLEPEVQSLDEWFSSLQLHPDDAKMRESAMQAHLNGLTPAYEGEWRVWHPNGHYRWVRVRGMCVRDGTGKPLRMAGSVSDIDARKRAEESLRQSEERYALAVAGSDDGVWDWDLTTGMAFESARARELQGLEPGPELTRLDDLLSSLRVHPDDAPRRAEGIRAHLAGETPAYECEYRVRRDDGSYRWIRVRALCIRDATGKPYRMAGSVSDVHARKEAEEGMRKSQERFELAVAGSNDGIVDWDIVNDRVFASQRALRIIGAPTDQTYYTMAEWMRLLRTHPDDLARHAAETQRRVDGDTAMRENEYRVLHPNGEYRWVRVRGSAVAGPDGKAIRWAGSVSDIDDQKRTEEALRHSEERYALAMTGSNEGHWMWDIRSGIIFVSAKLSEIFGMPGGAQMMGADNYFASVPFHPDDRELVRRNREDHVAGLTPRLDHEFRIVVPASGEVRWIHTRAQCFRDEHGGAIRMAGSTTDVTQRKQSEEALRRSEERYQLAVAGSNEGLWDWDLASDMLFLSPRAQRLTFVEQNEPLRPRREWIALTQYHPDDVAPVGRALSRHLRGETPFFTVEYRVRHHTGTWHWFRQRGLALRDQAGRPYRMAGSMEDITDRKNTEAERERLETQLRQAQKLEAIGTLAGGIAHDFNNILAAILGYGEMAQKDAPEGTAQRRHIDAALSAGMRAKSLVERILAFSRSGMGERVPVHVQSVVVEALDQLSASLPHGITLEQRLEAGDAAVLGDPTQVHQVVMNLCANAVQAMKSQGTLTVMLDRVDLSAPRCATSVLPDGAYVRLCVRDTGVGIAAQVIERIFDPFFTTKEVGVGTGLGLSLVHGIVTDLGGGIDVQSRLGEGASFTVYLPWNTTVQAPESVQETVVGGGGETVLLVDDEEALVRLGEEMIAGLGYEPVGFTSSTAALEAFRATPGRFDAVLSDESMPEMTGSELAKAIREIRDDIPIVLMSGYVTAALTHRARDAGVLDVLAKPLVARDIARSLADALQQQPS
jgi:PAS domain S-box-containing protein